MGEENYGVMPIVVAFERKDGFQNLGNFVYWMVAASFQKLIKTVQTLFTFDNSEQDQKCDQNCDYFGKYQIFIRWLTVDSDI